MSEEFKNEEKKEEKKSAKKAKAAPKAEKSLDEQIAEEVAKVKEQFLNSDQIKEIKGLKIKEAVRHEKNKALIEAAIEAGYKDAPSIGEKIGMTASGVHRYCAEMGITMRKTQEEIRREVQEEQRRIQEEAEKFNLGLKQ